MKSAGWFLFAGVVIIFIFANWPDPGFIQADIGGAKTSIRDYYSRKNIDVEDVSLIRESPQKLIGYVRLKIDSVEMTKTCTATYGTDESHKYFWICQ